MNQPGLKNLGDAAVAAINAATAGAVITSGVDVSGSAIAYVDRLEGMLAATLQANFTYGSGGGTSLKVIWETSLDQGVSWIEVCRMAFGIASEENIVNLSGLTPRTTPYTPVALADDSSVDGIFGDRWRARILAVGVYVGNAAVSLRLNAR